ncbi:membrane protein [Clostridiales bacterium PH28_bin88]|nr:membrane protein [Clostridiales bacterium PH28_bin88]
MKELKKEILYTTQLQAGLGAIEETRKLLELWEPDMSASQLFQYALDSGNFPSMSARRLQNLISECFAPRYLVVNDYPAIILKKLEPILTRIEFTQLLFLFTCRANLILTDFVREIYWHRYSSGYEIISNEDARDFVTKAIQHGKTVKPWSDNVIERVAGYLTRCCADFGMLEPGIKRVRKIIPYRIEPTVSVFLAYDLHFSGAGDNAMAVHADWELFGMEREDVVNELKRLSFKKFFIVQTAGDVIRVGWNYKNWEELTDAIAQG